MDSVFDRLRAFAAVYELEFKCCFHEDTRSQALYFNKIGDENTWCFVIEFELLAAMSNKLTENYIYNKIVTGVTENLLKKKRSK